MALQYQIGQHLELMCSILNIDPEKVLARVGLSRALLGQGDFSAPAQTCFQMWDAMMIEAALAPKLKSLLAERIAGGSISVESLAKQLNMSKRSLQRRMSEEGTNFQTLLSQTRFELAKRYLRESALSYQEIAYLLGFQDTSSFYRAFQNWAGTTPSEYRGSEL